MQGQETTPHQHVDAYAMNIWSTVVLWKHWSGEGRLASRRYSLKSEASLRLTLAVSTAYSLARERGKGSTEVVDTFLIFSTLSLTAA